MFFSIISRARFLVTASVLAGAATILPASPAAAEPSRDDQFLALLDKAQIPAIENIPSVIIGAHQVCDGLDSGMTAEDVVIALRERAFDTDPAARDYPPERVTRTITRFIAAAVRTYCPLDEGKIGSIMQNSA